MLNDNPPSPVTPQRQQVPTSIINKLYAAVNTYVKASGGNIVVIGGIECQEWPGEMPYTFRIAVRCTGKPPTYMNPEPPTIKRDKRSKRRAKP